MTSMSFSMKVYRKRARFTVVFVSRYCVSKPWTRHERQSAQARAFADVGPYLLPVRLDDSELPGLRPTVGYIDARNTPAERLVSLIEQKLSAAPGMATSQQPLLRSPRTAEHKSASFWLSVLMSESIALCGCALAGTPSP